jgi:hypothetical protein
VNRPSLSPSPLNLLDLSDHELAQIELPVGDEALDQGSHIIAAFQTPLLSL